MIEEHDPGARFLLALSPVSFAMNQETGRAIERVFPSLLNAYSDFRMFYQGSQIGIPDFWSGVVQRPNVEPASHGLVHVDHRLLSREAQEISILVSAAIADSDVFVPPFNKWNEQTEGICGEHGIDLVKFETGWKHLKFQARNHGAIGQKYYFHTHDFDLTFLEEWLNT